MKIKSQKDFYAGLMYSAFGGAFVWTASGYTIGSAARMGPGYFPILLGTILAAIGVLIMVTALRKGPADGDKVGSWAWRPLFFVLGANVLFGALLAGVPALGIPSFGLIVATYVLVPFAALGGDEFKLKEILIAATVLALGSYLAFVKLLNLQFPVWPSFITG